MNPLRRLHGDPEGWAAALLRGGFRLDRPCLLSVVAFHVPRLYACLLESGLETALDEGDRTA